MYSETDLELVSSSIPIYTKLKPTNTTQTPKRGHFACHGCDAGKLSGTRTYITALVYDFDRLGPIFAFLYSRADTHYQTPSDAFTQLMATTANFDWIYRAKNELRDTVVHVRGWWDIERNRDFKHKNGVINLGDHCNFDDPMTDGGEIVNPEFGIKLFIPSLTGMYRNAKRLETIANWNDEEIYNNTFVHPTTDRAATLSHPTWARYGIDASVKDKTKRGRRRGGTQRAQAEHDRLLRAMETIRPPEEAQQNVNVPPTGFRTAPPQATTGRIRRRNINFTNMEGERERIPPFRDVPEGGNPAFTPPEPNVEHVWNVAGGDDL